jgi:hypothetical protein
MDTQQPVSSVSGMSQPLPSASALLSNTIKAIRANWKTIGGIMLIPTVVSIAAAIIPVSASAAKAGVTILSVIVDVLAAVALMYAIISQKNFPYSIQKTYTGGIVFIFAYIVTNILSGLISFGGFILLIIPGIIFGIRLSMTQVVLFDDGKRRLDALAASWQLVIGREGSVFWRLLFLGIIMILISIGLVGVAITLSFGSSMEQVPAIMDPYSEDGPVLVQIISVLVSNFLMVPIATMYIFLLYSGLKAGFTPWPAEETEKLKRKLFWWAVWGVVACILFLAFIFVIVAFIALQLNGSGSSTLPSSPPLPFDPSLLTSSVFKMLFGWMQ